MSPVPSIPARLRRAVFVCALILVSIFPAARVNAYFGSIPVSYFADDAHTWEPTYQDWNAQYLYFGPYLTNPAPFIRAGVAFAGIPVPPGATVTSAFLRVYSYGETLNPTYTLIQGESTNNAYPFQYLPAMSDRFLTTSSVPWTITNAWVHANAYDSPDITPIIQEIVSRPDWAVSNALAVFISNTSTQGELRAAFTFEGSFNLGGSMAYVPRLFVGYTIPNDPGAVRFSEAAYSAAEAAGFATVRVERVNGAFGPMSASFSTSNGTAQAGVHYTATNGTLSWENGDGGAKTVLIPLLDDASYSGDKVFTVRLAGTALESPFAATVTILDNDQAPPPEMEVTGNAVVIASGDESPALADHTDFGALPLGGNALARTFTIRNTGAGPLTLTGTPRVAVSGPHASDFSVSLQPPATLAPGSSTPFRVVFSPTASGLRSAVLSLACNDDDENPYRFAVQGTGRPEYSCTAYVTTGGGDAFAWGPESQSWSEQYVYFGPYLTNPVPFVRGALAFDGVTIPRGAVITSAYVNAFAYATRSNTTQILIQGEAADDAAPFDVPPFIAARPLTELSVPWSITNRWTGNLDYRTPDITPIVQELVNRPGWAPSNAMAIFLSTASTSGTERLFLSREGSVAQTGVASYAPRLIVGYTLDAAATGTVQFSASAYSAGEGAGAVTVTVSRLYGFAGPLSVSYGTSNGSAAAGADYTAAAGSLEWTNGETAAKSFTVALLDDTVYESNEFFSVWLAGEGLGVPASATVAIVEDDPRPQPGRLQFSAAAYSTVEGATVKLTVKRVGGSNGVVSVKYACKPKTALAWQDYTAKTGTLTWLNGQTLAKAIKIPVRIDGVREAAEKFIVVLKTPVGATPGTPYQATVTIAANTKGTVAAKSAAGGLAELAEALDCPEAEWITSGLAPWTAEEAAGRSGSADELGQPSWLQAEFEGPGRLAFRWRVQGDERAACLLMVDDRVARVLKAGFDWTEESVVLEEGAHNVRWIFVGGPVPGLAPGKAWLDEVDWRPAAEQAVDVEGN